jgi:hypothetical protein
MLDVAKQRYGSIASLFTSGRTQTVLRKIFRLIKRRIEQQEVALNLAPKEDPKPAMTSASLEVGVRILFWSRF